MPAPNSETQSLYHSALYILMRRRRVKRNVLKSKPASVGSGCFSPRLAFRIARTREPALPASQVSRLQIPNSWIIQRRVEKPRWLPRASASVRRPDPGSNRYQRSSDLAALLPADARWTRHIAGPSTGRVRDLSQLKAKGDPGPARSRAHERTLRDDPSQKGKRRTIDARSHTPD